MAIKLLQYTTNLTNVRSVDKLFFFFDSQAKNSIKTCKCLCTSKPGISELKTRY